MALRFRCEGSRLSVFFLFGVFKQHFLCCALPGEGFRV